MINGVAALIDLTVNVLNCRRCRAVISSHEQTAEVRYVLERCRCVRLEDPHVKPR